MIVCWCGNASLDPFSQDYFLCASCRTLVFSRRVKTDVTHVTDTDADLYGRDYYLTRLPEKYGYPDLSARARTDLPERCLYWLRTLLKYKLPPAKILELGSAHGGFVAMLRWAGFDAVGLELSPWIVDFAKQIFEVPMLLGPVENQKIEQGSLDVIVLMDVLEHMPDPLGTIRRCLALLRPDGILMIQTPLFPEHKSYKQMIDEADSFLQQLKEDEHLYLFSRNSISEFFRRLGAEHLKSETAIFSHYDMFFVASRAPIVERSPEEMETALCSKAGGRLVWALCDLDDRNRELRKVYDECEADRATRLGVIERQAKEFAEKMAECETERAARFEVIERQAKELESMKGSLSRKLTALLRKTLHRLG